MRGATIALVLSALCLLATCEDGSTTKDFDFLQLVLQWPPTMTKSPSSDITGFTIHGLWPSDNSSFGPGYCSDQAFSPSDISSLMDKMNVMWPSFDGSNDNFWSHEWCKHGTCAVEYLPQLSTQYDFFHEVLTLASSFDPVSILNDANIYPSSSKEYTPAAIQAGLAKGGWPATIQCTDNNLGSLSFCVSKYNYEPFTCDSFYQKQSTGCGSTLYFPPFPNSNSKSGSGTTGGSSPAASSSSTTTSASSAHSSTADSTTDSSSSSHSSGGTTSTSSSKSGSGSSSSASSTSKKTTHKFGLF